MELRGDEPRKLQGPPDRILGPADMGGRRDLSALGLLPFWVGPMQF